MVSLFAAAFTAACMVLNCARVDGKLLTVRMVAKRLIAVADKTKKSRNCFIIVSLVCKTDERNSAGQSLIVGKEVSVMDDKN